MTVSASLPDCDNLSALVTYMRGTYTKLRGNATKQKGCPFVVVVFSKGGVSQFPLKTGKSYTNVVCGDYLYTAL